MKFKKGIILILIAVIISVSGYALYNYYLDYAFLTLSEKFIKNDNITNNNTVNKAKPENVDKQIENEIEDFIQKKQEKSINQNNNSTTQNSAGSNSVTNEQQKPAITQNSETKKTPATTIKPAEFNEVVKKISSADKSRAVNIVLSSLSTDDKKKIANLRKNGLTSEEKSQIYKIVSNAVSASKKSELWAIYNKYLMQQ